MFDHPTIYDNLRMVFARYSEFRNTLTNVGMHDFLWDSGLLDDQTDLDAFFLRVIGKRSTPHLRIGYDTWLRSLVRMSQRMFPGIDKPADRLYTLLRDRVITSRMIEASSAGATDAPAGVDDDQAEEEAELTLSPPRAAIQPPTYVSDQFEPAPHLATLLSDQLAEFETVLRVVWAHYSTGDQMDARGFVRLVQQAGLVASKSSRNAAVVGTGVVPWLSNKHTAKELFQLAVGCSPTNALRFPYARFKVSLVRMAESLFAHLHQPEHRISALVEQHLLPLSNRIQNVKPTFVCVPSNGPYAVHGAAYTPGPTHHGGPYTWSAESVPATVRAAWTVDHQQWATAEPHSISHRHPAGPEPSAQRVPYQAVAEVDEGRRQRFDDVKQRNARLRGLASTRSAMRSSEAIEPTEADLHNSVWHQNTRSQRIASQAQSCYRAASSTRRMGAAT